MSWNDTGEEKPNPRLDAALAYVEKLSWSVVPLHWIDQGRCSCGDPHTGNNAAGKHPHARYAPNGTHSASKDPATVRRWYESEPRLNIGIALGHASNIVVLDVDPRNGGDDALMQIVKRYGEVPATASAYTGGGGVHYIFKDTGQRVKSPGKGLDALSNGKLIVVEPSTHASGKAYAWDNEADPLQGCVIADPPLWFVDLVKRENMRSPLKPAAVGYLDTHKIADIRAALEFLEPDNYKTWIDVGQALHATEAPEAFEIWDTWAQKSAKYTNGETQTKWGGFTVGRGLNVESIFAWAADQGWINGGNSAPVPVAIEPARIAQTPAPAPPGTGGPPSRLLALPGPPGDLVDAINASAPKSQPQFAVQTVLAIVSVILGRRYCAVPFNNYTSQYFLAVGESGCGKEYGRKVAMRVLRDCGLSPLIGPSGYTSVGAVLSALQDAPAHLAIMDEFGDMLGNSKATGNFHKRESIDILKPLWGQLGDEVTPIAYSKQALTKEQRAKFASTTIMRPALSILGMTTPAAFYGALTDQSISGGFLNRFLIVETNIGRSITRENIVPFVTPQSFIDWAKATREGAGNLAAVELGADMAPDPILVPINDDARKLFRAFEHEALALQNELAGEGLADLEGRGHEKALRLGTSLAGADNPREPVIHARHAEHAIEYVRHYTRQTIDAVRQRMHGSEFAEWSAAFLDCIKAAKHGKGRTVPDLFNHCRTFQKLNDQQRTHVLRALQSEGRIAWAEVRPKEGRVAARLAFVALTPGADA